MRTGPRPYLPSLEGIRGYAFLMVFAVHFSGTSWSMEHTKIIQYPWLLVQQLSFVAVPIFFTLSGYLITGILFDSLGRQGFFKVFYIRRALRVFPLYYLTLLIVFLFLRLNGVQILRRDCLFLVYLHNLWPGAEIYQLSPKIYIAHLWSLAVEEQFYLLWPLFIWALRGRRNLLVFCYVSIVVAFIGRVWVAQLHLDPTTVYQNTVLRSDSIMLGAVLALHERGPMKHLGGLSVPARWVTIGLLIALSVRALVFGQALPYDHFGIVVVTPMLALLGAAVVVLAINSGNAVNRASTHPWIVHLGKLSYGLYVFHQLLAPIFLSDVIPYLKKISGHFGGQLMGMFAAFSLIYLLSRLAYRFVEQPAMDLKTHFRYGAAQKVRPRLAIAVPRRSLKTQASQASLHRVTLS